MASSAPAARRSTRASQQPLSLAEEQAASAFSLLEQRDVAAALRLSLQASWDSDEEDSGAASDDDASNSSSDEEEEKKGAALQYGCQPVVLAHGENPRLLRVRYDFLLLYNRRLECDECSVVAVRCLVVVCCALIN